MVPKPPAMSPWTPAPARRQKYRPSPLELKKPDPLPATVYSPEFDEVEPRAITPTDISGLFDNSDTSSSSSAVSSRAESPVERRFVATRGRKRSVKGRGSSGEVVGTGTPSTPVTPMSPFAPNNNFKSSNSHTPSSSPPRHSSRHSSRHSPPSPTSRPGPPSPTNSARTFSTRTNDSRRPSRKAGAILGLGLGLGHPPLATSRSSTPTVQKFKDPILDNWDVSDDDKPSKPLPLKPWQPLAVKKTPPINRSSSTSARARTKLEQPQPRKAAARLSDRGFREGTIDEDGIPSPSPRKATPASSSTPSSTTSSFRNLDLPKRSPSAPIVTSMSTVSFELDEYPVIFSNLPIEETDIFNIIPTDFILSSDPPSEYTLHPSWTTPSPHTYTASNAALKSELTALAAMLDPQPTPLRALHPSPPPEVPSPASIRPDSRWSDYSEADSVKESWRSSVLHHLHLPSVTSVRRKLDLRAPVAAAKQGISRRKTAVSSVPEVPETIEASTYSLPAALAAANRTSASVAAAHRASVASAAGMGTGGLVFRRIATGRSDSIVTLSKSILRPESRAGSSGSSVTAAAAGGGGRPGSAKSSVVASPVGSPTSDEERVVSPRGGRFKDVFGKWDTRKREERRRMELKRKITVIGTGVGTGVGQGGYI